MSSRSRVPRVAILVFALVAALVPALVSERRANAASPHVVISQVYGGGGNSGATLRHDFIEVFNRGERTVDVTGWSVQYTSATGRSWQVTELSGSIRPGQYYLVKEAGGGGGTQSLPRPDARGAIALSATSGKVALVAAAERLPCGASCAKASGVVDFVGYGASADESEGSGPTATLSNTEAARRTVAGCADSDDNASDFVVRAPRPRNTGSPLAPCQARADLAVSMAASTSNAQTGTRFRYAVGITNNGPSTATNARITVTLAEALVLEATNPAGACTRTARTVTCPIGTLDSGRTRTVALYVTPLRSGASTSTATAVASEPDATPALASVAVSVTGPDCEIVGTPGADVLAGTDADDVMCSLSGDDRVSPGHGDDAVMAGTGSDRVHGGSGDDRVAGSAGADSLTGGGAADTLLGGEHDDVIDARDGVASNDTVNGGSGTDACSGDPGDALNACP